MNDGEELTDVVRALNLTEMEKFLTGAQIYSAVFHRTWLTTAGGIHGNGIGFHLHGKRQHGIVTVVGRILVLRHEIGILVLRHQWEDLSVYIRSGISIPRSAMAEQSTFATFADNSRRSAFFCVSDSFKIERS